MSTNSHYIISRVLC